MSTLWMGNLEPYMDEKFVTRAFGTMGEQVISVRIIRNKVTGGALGYCFVELSDEGTAERCLRKINGKPLPGSNPARRFKLNRSTFGKQGESSQMFSLFVGDLTPEVDDGMLYEFFYNRYPSCRGGKVVLDSTGNSKGCGFVQFPDERLQKKALEECQGALGLGGKPLRLSLAANKNRQPQADRSWQSNSGGYRENYQQYQQQPYSGNGYYANWGYDQTGGNYGYNGYNHYDYTQYPPPQSQETVAEDEGLEAFDFHKECSRMRWDRLQILVDAVAEAQDEYSYFMVNAVGTTVTQQKGTFRSNCMDCLDRTNVIQSLLARRSLQSQLQRMGVLNVGQRIEEQADFEKIYKNAWADNANACAVQYAGTGALKTDFTRTGKRTQWGLVMDGWNSMIRYYKNNFSDGFRQDSIDLFLGNYALDESDGPTPLRVQKDWKFLALPAIMVVAFSMCVICLLMAGDTWTETLAYILFWGLAGAVTAAIIMFNGRDFVDAPKLVQKEKMD